MEIRAELDAAYFHLYGLSREEAVYVLTTFQGTGEAGDARSTGGAGDGVF